MHFSYVSVQNQHVRDSYLKIPCGGKNFMHKTTHAVPLITCRGYRNNMLFISFLDAFLQFPFLPQTFLPSFLLLFFLLFSSTHLHPTPHLPHPLSSNSYPLLVSSLPSFFVLAVSPCPSCHLFLPLAFFHLSFPTF